jgi:4-carboxymuconolactone decarboxylase
MPARLTPLVPEHLDADQRALYERIATGPRAKGPQAFRLTHDDGSLAGPFGAMLLSPGIGTALQELGSALRFGSSLTARARELAILVVAAAWDCEFELAAHEAVGASIGISDADLAAVRLGGEAGADESERLVVRVARALATGGQDLGDAQYAAAVDALGEAQLFELSALVGYYALIALQLRLFRVPPPS